MPAIEKKISPEMFEAISSGKKNYEFRIADFEVKEGGTLMLKEWNPQSKLFTGRSIEKKVTYVGKFDINNTYWPAKELIEKGFYILALE